MSKTKKYLIFGIAVLLIFAVIAGIILLFSAHRDPLSELEPEAMELLFSDITERAHVMGMKPDGSFFIPEEHRQFFKYDHAYLCQYKNGSAIYFQTFGFLDESRGYLYLTDAIDWQDYIDTGRYTPTLDISSSEQLTDNILKITTG